MNRDDFSSKTKLRVAMRAGGRCSNPSCDVFCWLPNSISENLSSLGKVAHICAASENGPRYDAEMSSDDRKSIDNAIFLCANCHTLIDADPNFYTTSILYDWKIRHEAQIRGLVHGDLLLPTVELKNNGFTVSCDSNNIITVETIGNRIENTLEIKNNTDFEYRSIGFTVQYPEFIEFPPKIETPPGCEAKIEGENMECNLFISGGGYSKIPKRSHVASFTIETSSLLQGDSLRIRLISFPDTIFPHWEYSDKIFWWISGEVRVFQGKTLERQRFTVPLFFDYEKRIFEIGVIHKTNGADKRYINLHRGY